MDKILKDISKVIHNILTANKVSLNKIILFGSRAKGTNFNNSDFDLLLISDTKLNRAQKAILAKMIRNELAELYLKNRIASGTDIIIRTPAEAEKFRSLAFSVTAQALIEGKVIWPLK
ncbi:MAG: nucleotidyltransferase domain-containing protein [Brevinematales bacterium]|nr:nucleotidyltransferase domain-containing protein [Brevinematales bacterium]